MQTTLAVDEAAFSSFWRLDWVLLLSVAALCGIGSALVWSATRLKLELAGEDP